MEQPISWISLALQVPLVGVFIWYSLKSQERYLQSLDKRDEEYAKRNEAVCIALGKVAQALDVHDRGCDERFMVWAGVQRQQADDARKRPNDKG